MQLPDLEESVREQDPNVHLQARGQETEERNGPGSEHGAMGDEREMGEEEEERMKKKVRGMYGPDEL